MTLLDDYLKYQLTYEKKYGKKTIVVIEVGAFYEWYGIDNEVEKVGKPAEICDLLNVQLTRKNKSIIGNSRKNPLMGGVTSNVFPKYKSVLIQNGYTVVMINQFQIQSNRKVKVFERKVTKIYSPGTDIDECTTTNSIFVINILIDLTLSISISCIDLTTGENFLFSFYDTEKDKSLAIDQTFKVIHSYDPKEIILSTYNKEDQIKFIRDLELDKPHFCVHTHLILNKHKKINYQNELLRIVYPSTGLLTPIEYLNLEHYPNVSLSYTILIKFVKDHNRETLLRLKLPKLKHTSEDLALLGDTLYQLNLLDLFNILNKTSTSMGSREFKNTILNPITSIEKLRTKYTQIEWMRKEGYEKYEVILSKICDIERLHRKLALQTLNPSEFASLDSSYEYVLELLNLEIKDFWQIFNHKLEVQEYRNKYQKYFNVEEMAKHTLANIGASFIQKGISIELDDIQSEIDNSMNILNTIANECSNLINISGSIKIEYSEKEGCHYLTTTEKRGQSLKNKFKSSISGDTEYRFKTVGGNSKITSDEIESISHKICFLKEKMRVSVKQIYLDILNTLYQKYNDVLSKIVKFVVDIDILKSSTKVSIENGYCKPEIIDSEKSFIECKQLRHPIIEKIQDDIPFIPNDINLGKEMTGMILYSINAAGKSTLLRSIGLSIIMAQSGNYVAASSFKFSPYYNLISKIANRDDMMKGQSTFVVEMKNLKTVLLRGNNRSLILEDELCSGTEYNSALAIVAGSVLELAKRNINFVLTTHLHELVKLKEIKELYNVKCFHLKVTIQNSEIIFDRILEPGSGPDTYGIEIAEALNLGSEFILKAKQIRYQLKEGKDSSDKFSRYNSKVKVEKCYICNKKDGLHTHHIHFQSAADEKGMIGSFHKNIKHNLVVVCEECHYNIHSGNIIVKGYTQTTSGIRLQFKKKLKNNSKQD